VVFIPQLVLMFVHSHGGRSRLYDHLAFVITLLNLFQETFLFGNGFRRQTLDKGIVIVVIHLFGGRWLRLKHGQKVITGIVVVAVVILTGRAAIVAAARKRRGFRQGWWIIRSRRSSCRGTACVVHIGGIARGRNLVVLIIRGVWLV